MKKWTRNPEYLSKLMARGRRNYEVKLDEGAWINVGNNTSYNFAELNDGKHTVYVKAVDKAGNSVEHLVNFTVDTTIFPPMWTVIIALVPAITVSVAVVYFLRRKKPANITTFVA